MRTLFISFLLLFAAFSLGAQKLEQHTVDGDGMRILRIDEDNFLRIREFNFAQKKASIFLLDGKGKVKWTREYKFKHSWGAGLVLHKYEDNIYLTEAINAAYCPKYPGKVHIARISLEEGEIADEYYEGIDYCYNLGFSMNDEGELLLAKTVVSDRGKWVNKWETFCPETLKPCGESSVDVPNIYPGKWKTAGYDAEHAYFYMSEVKGDSSWVHWVATDWSGNRRIDKVLRLNTGKYAVKGPVMYPTPDVFLDKKNERMIVSCFLGRGASFYSHRGLFVSFYSLSGELQYQNIIEFKNWRKSIGIRKRYARGVHQYININELDSGMFQFSYRKYCAVFSNEGKLKRFVKTGVKLGVATGVDECNYELVGRLKELGLKVRWYWHVYRVKEGWLVASAGFYDKHITFTYVPNDLLGNEQVSK